MRIALVSLALLVLCAAPAAAQQSDPNCFTADPPPVTKPPQPLRFGITPGAAGSVGGGQAGVAPEDEGQALAALRELRPGGRALVMRLNRLFWADGDEGIARFAKLTDTYAAEGFEVESQVRYHPPEGKEGDIPAWEEYVRAVVRELGKRPALSALSITNEANFDGSQNTSDGAYEGVVDALVRGIVVARSELDAMGRSDVRLGFSMMWRWRAESDRRFWEDIGAKADANPSFRAAVDYVGLQVYPGLVWPPVKRPGVDAGAEVIEALTLLRGCYMPKAKLGPEVEVWVSENGYATNLGRDEASQAADLSSTIDALSKWSGELGITDYRYFNLRDNDSDGSDLFAAVGLLRDDYTRKPAFEVLRGLTEQHGAAPRPQGTYTKPELLLVARRRGRRLVIVTGWALGRPCTGTVRIRVGGGRARAVRLRPDCSFRATIRASPRRVRAVARWNGLVVKRQLRKSRARR